MRIVAIVGARPQFIKLYPIIERKGANEVITIHTGQHYDYELSKQFFDELDLPDPDFNLGVGSASHGVQTANMLSRIEEVLMGLEGIDWVMCFIIR